MTPKIHVKDLLLLEPIDEAKVAKAMTEPTAINTLLQAKFPHWFNQWHRCCSLSHSTVHGIEGGPSYDHNVFTGYHSSRRDATDDPTIWHSILAYNSAAITRAEASWRRMLVCQPPIRQLEVVIHGPCRGFEFHGSVTTLDFTNTDKAGVRMAILYDLVQRFVDRQRHFGVDWWENNKVYFDHGEEASCWHHSREPLPLHLSNMDPPKEIALPDWPDKMHLFLFNNTHIPVRPNLKPSTRSAKEFRSFRSKAINIPKLQWSQYDLHAWGWS